VLGARRVLLGHHDDWLPGFSVATDMEPIRAAFAERAPTTELLEHGYLAGTEIFAGLQPPRAGEGPDDVKRRRTRG
jgi:hypothetical protein